MRIRTASLLCVAVIALVSVAARGGWVKVDDFESYSVTGDPNLDSMEGKGSWQARGYDANLAFYYQVALDPDGGSNNVLMGRIPSGEGYATLFNDSASLTIVESNTTPATIFFRLRAASDGNNDWTAAFSHQAAPTAHVSMKGYALLKTVLEDDPNLDILVREGPNPPTGAAGSNYDRGDAVKDVWYSFWYVVYNRENASTTDALADTYDVYIQGGAYTDITQIDANAAFRSGNVLDSLLTFATIVSGSTGTGYLDDLYIDTAGVNLTVAPEPASLALLMAGGLAVASRRRRRR